MKYYNVAQINIKDQSWVKEYIENVTKMIEAYGGHYLARTPNFERIEGEGTLKELFLIIEWPSKEKALAFYESDDYKPYLRKRLEGAESEIFLIAGEDIAKVAQIPS